MKHDSEIPSEAGRFSALLNPIRDITASWGIDVAQELTDYADSLGIDVISGIEDEGLDVPVDFAEAALLVQGSTSIYSRKVEHLYVLVYTAVSALNQMHVKLKEGNTDPDGNVADNDAEADALLDMDKVDFLVLDDEVPQADAKALTLPDERGDPGGLLRDKTCLPPVPPMLLHRSVEASNQLGGVSYKMSTAHLHSSGAMVMEGCPPLDENLDTLPASHRDEPDFDATQPFDVSHDDADDWSNDGGRSPMSLGNSPTEKKVDPAKSACGSSLLAAASKSIMETATKYGIAFSERPVRAEKPKKDPFFMLDPHEEIPNLNKPTKVGKTYRRPRGKCLSLADSLVRQIPKNEELLDSILEKIPRNSSVFSYVMCSELRQQYAFILRKRKAKNRKRSGSSGLADTVGAGPLDAAEVDYHDPDVDSFNGDDDNNFEHEQDAGIESPDHLRLPPVALDDNSEFELSLFGEIGNEAQMSSHLEYLASSYEETCRKHLEQTAWMWEQRTTDVNLIKRVEEWTSRIHPLLEQEEERSKFDITKYSEVVLTDFENNLETAGTTEVRISSLLRQPAKFEVCRMFLATLQLANGYAVEIVPPEACEVSDFLVRSCLPYQSDQKASEGAEDQDRGFSTPASKTGGAKRSRQAGCTPKSDKREPFRPRLHHSNIMD